MIGQRELLKKIHGQIDRSKFPRFSIFIGDKGSGKKTLVLEIAKMLGTMIANVGTNVDSIREAIENAYKLSEPVLYVIADCDNMSSAAANALLKVTEEPPHNAYFILTCESLDNLLQTIRSRGVTYMLEPYTYDNKCDYLDTKSNRPSEEEVEFILDVASNLGEIEELCNLNITEFEDYVKLVIDNVAEVSDSNAFKIGDKIALKDDNEKYGLSLFWKAFRAICVTRMNNNTDDTLRYARAIAITGDYLQQLRIRGINKTMLFDNWLIAIREEWV